MIRINKNSVNSIIATTSEKTTLVNPYYLFSFQSNADKNTTNFICVDSSSATTRYNLFTIIDTGSTSVNLTASTVNLTEGWYNYTIYEQTSDTNLYITGTTSSVECGLAYVSGSSQFNYIKDDSTINFKFDS